MRHMTGENLLRKNIALKTKVSPKLCLLSRAYPLTLLVCLQALHGVSVACYNLHTLMQAKSIL